MSLPPQDLPKAAKVKHAAADEARLRKRRFRGLLIAVLGVALVSTNFVTGKYALAEYNSFTVLPLWFIGPILAGTVYIMGYGGAWRVRCRNRLP